MTRVCFDGEPPHPPDALHREFARRVGSRLLLMDGGRSVHDGDPRAVIDDPPSARFKDFFRHVS